MGFSPALAFRILVSVNGIVVEGIARFIPAEIPATILDDNELPRTDEDTKTLRRKGFFKYTGQRWSMPIDNVA
jgi:hypothetical protein